MAGWLARPAFRFGGRSASGLASGLRELGDGFSGFAGCACAAGCAGWARALGRLSGGGMCRRWLRVIGCALGCGARAAAVGRAGITAAIGLPCGMGLGGSGQNRGAAHRQRQTAGGSVRPPVVVAIACSSEGCAARA